MDAWKQSEEMLKKYERGGGGVYLKLVDDGDKERVVFRGGPFARSVIFMAGRYVNATEKLIAEGHRCTARFAINVVLYDTRQVKVLEQGAAVYGDLSRLREKYGLEKWVFEIQRHGGPKDPRTTYTILPERELSPEELSAFAKLKLHDLPRLYSNDRSGESGKGRLESFDEYMASLVEPQVAQSMAAELKAMPREMADQFLKKFGIARVRDLPAGEVAAARAFIQQLHTELAALQQSDAEIDPFA